MLVLPASRYEVKCGWKWDKDKQEYVDTGKGCSQKIFIEKLPGGKFKITNAENGRGGNVAEAHKCHNTGFHEVDNNWKMKYRLAQQNLPCGFCGEKYNSYKNPLCPICYRLECRSCGNMQQWIYIPEQFPTKCSNCGHDRLDVVKLPREK